jgi:putative spermidine/putrescine transport system permease protein
LAEPASAPSAKLPPRGAVKSLLLRLDPLWPGLALVFDALLALFLVAPIVVVILVSFNTSRVTFPPADFSLESYTTISGALFDAFVTSVIVAVLSVVIALSIAIPASIALMRSRLPAMGPLLVFLRMPLQVPSIVIGMALYQFYVAASGSGIPLRGQLAGLVLAHVLIVLPYMLITLTARVALVGPTYEDASYGLGAGFFRTLRLVTLPLMRPAILASCFIGFLVSFDDVAISVFLVSANNTTFPVELFDTAVMSLDSSTFAAAGLAILFTLAVTIGMQRLVGMRTALGR